jgi:predicted DNA binding CopG/RHH family protein
MKKTKIKTVPKFKNEDEEVSFWDTHSVLDFPKVFKPIKMGFSNLKPSTAKVTLRLPKMMLDDLKMIANMQDVPYQSLMKIFLSQKINEKYYSKFTD